MIGRKMWISPTGGTATADHYELGCFLTEPELEQLIRKAVEMARERHEGNFFYADYEIVEELVK